MKGQPEKARHFLDRIHQPTGSSRAGDVALLWAPAPDRKIPATIDGICGRHSDPQGPTPGTLRTVRANRRALHPESATRLERWVPTTDLPRLAGISPDAFTKDTFLTGLDRDCGEDLDLGGLVDRTGRLDEELFRAWRERPPLPLEESEVFAYDRTSVLCFEVTDPFAELGYNAPDVGDLLRVNLGLRMSRSDTMPVRHAPFEGSRHGVAAVRNVLARLSRRPLAPGEEGSRGTLIGDCRMVSGDHVKAVEEMGWPLVCGLPKRLDAVREVQDATDVPAWPETPGRQSDITTVYAVEAGTKLFGKDRRAVVAFHGARRAREADQRNGELAKIPAALGKLSEEGTPWKEAKWC